MNMGYIGNHHRRLTTLLFLRIIIICFVFIGLAALALELTSWQDGKDPGRR